MTSGTPAALLNIRVARRIVRDTPLLGAVKGVEYLRKGYSADRKYVLRERGRPRYLLRLSDIKLRRRRQGEFEVLGRLRRRGWKRWQAWIQEILRTHDFAAAAPPAWFGQ